MHTDSVFFIFLKGKATDSCFGSFFDLGFAFSRSTPFGADETALVFDNFSKLIPCFSVVRILLKKMFSTIVEILLDVFEHLSNTSR